MLDSEEEKNNRDEDKDNDDASSASSESVGDQVRISFTLAPDCLDRCLEVPSEPMAVPASISRKGLSAVVNHLLGRGVDGTDGLEEDIALPQMRFDFILGTKSSNKLLRTGIEREARRNGLSLEEAIPLIYFPAQPQPESTGESEQQPDWISALDILTTGEHKSESDTNAKATSIICTGCYDGSIHSFQANGSKSSTPENTLTKIGSLAAHEGAVKCIGCAHDSSDDMIWIASGSMDHTIAVHQMNSSQTEGTTEMSLFAKLMGHASAISSLDIVVSCTSPKKQKLLASGEWDGGISVWDLNQEPDAATPEEDQQQPNKRSKKSSNSKATANSTISPAAAPILTPRLAIRAHSSKVSGISWGNHEKRNGNGALDHLVTGSWDHSLKVWDVERQDCILTLNGSRVVSCLDTSYHSSGIVATGHPDCTIRLWDMRISNNKESYGTTMGVADTTFKPSHSEWISSVRWSKQSPYHLASTSHDGKIKIWDIRSSLPLYTVRAFEKNDKALCLGYGQDGLVAVGGTDRVVKVFRQNQYISND